MSFATLHVAALAVSARLPQPPRAGLGLAVLDAFTATGCVLAVAEPNWIGMTGLVTAVGAIMIRRWELDRDYVAIKAENASLHDRLDALTVRVDATPNAPGPGPAPTPEPRA